MSEPRLCGCPESRSGLWCPACHGTGRIPPARHEPHELCPDRCHADSAKPTQQEGRIADLERALLDAVGCADCGVPSGMPCPTRCPQRPARRVLCASESGRRMLDERIALYVKENGHG